MSQNRYRSQRTSWRSNRRQQWNNNEQRNQQAEAIRQTEAIRSEELSDLPGYAFDNVTKKYYKIMPNAPGQPSGSTQSDMNRMNKEYSAKQRIDRNRITFEENFKKSSASRILPSLLRDIEIGRGRCTFPAATAKRVIEEQRIRHVQNFPSYNFEVTDNVSCNLGGCQFLDVKEDGKALIGCWGVNANDGAGYASCSQVISYKVSVDSRLDYRNAAENQAKILDMGKPVLDTNGRYSANTYGLRFESVDNCIYVESTLVDMAICPADADVTCIIYATANSFFSNNCKLVTRCKIFLKAVEQLTKEEGKDSMSSPIYNAEWMTDEHIWSTSFDQNHMRVGVGMEKCAAVFDVLSESKFKVSSGGKYVIAQQYSKEGHALYLGRLDANISCLDLRLSNSHTVGEFADSRSTCFIHQMSDRANHVLTDNFDGNLRLWDTRTHKVLLEFQGHKNNSKKVPCFVDEKERFVFAVGEDATARGWSLNSGELLCSIDCPQSVQANSDFPRIVYSDRWGGLNGNSAIVLAGLKGDLSVHELLL